MLSPPTPKKELRYIKGTQKGKYTHTKYTQKYISNSDVKWSHELGKYKNAFYKIIKLLRMDHRVGFTLANIQEEEANLVSSPSSWCPFLKRATVPTTKMKTKVLLWILLKRRQMVQWVSATSLHGNSNNQFHTPLSTEASALQEIVFDRSKMNPSLPPPPAWLVEGRSASNPILFTLQVSAVQTDCLWRGAAKTSTHTSPEKPLS